MHKGSYLIWQDSQTESTQSTIFHTSEPLLTPFPPPWTPWLTLPGEHFIVLQNSVQLKLFGDTFPDTPPLADWVVHPLVWEEHTILFALYAIILVFKSIRCVMAGSVPACKRPLDRACVLFFSVSPVSRILYCIKKGLHNYLPSEKT